MFFSFGIGLSRICREELEARSEPESLHFYAGVGAEPECLPVLKKRSRSGAGV